ncbi:MAG: hypothetical protein HYV02_06195 [Deltaproteobacteria bacterium]|nr:hypothetical protein [Deltaproteobacteria bacterium]
MVAPGQAIKLHAALAAAGNHAGRLGITRFVIATREMSADAVRHTVETLFPGTAPFAIDLLEAPIERVSATALQSGLEAYAVTHGPFAGIFSPMDRYVTPTSRLSVALEASGALRPGRQYLNPTALEAVTSKVQFRRLCDEIDPDRTAFHHPYWRVIGDSQLTAATVHALTGIGRDFFVIPRRGACARGVGRFERDDPQLEQRLSHHRALLQALRRDARSGVTGPAEVLLVDRVRGREYSCEIYSHDGCYEPVAVHAKYFMGDPQNPDGVFERIFVGQGPDGAGTYASPEAGLIAAQTVDLLQRLAAHGVPLGDGVFHVESRLHEESGKVYVIEVNPRPPGSLAFTLVPTATDGARDLYAMLLYTSLREPYPLSGYSWQVAADATLFAQGEAADESGYWQFDGFWLQERAADEPINVTDWEKEQLLARLGATLNSETQMDAQMALDAALALGYPVESARRLQAALAQQELWSGLELRLTGFEPFILPGKRIAELAGVYAACAVAIGNMDLGRDLAEAHLVAGLYLLLSQYLIAQATPIRAISHLAGSAA